MNTTIPNIEIRRAVDRGRTQIGWLDSAHAFSFGQYHDPQRLGYRSLRVINDDRVAPGAGFGEHGHDNMEIITWVLQGTLRHGDSLANARALGPGEVQVMSAGSGIRHSEFNGSDTEASHFLQVWITPKSRDIEPRYDQRTIGAHARHNRFTPIASGIQAHQAEGALPIHQDAVVLVADIDVGATVSHEIAVGRAAYVHVAAGKIVLAEHTLSAGDAAIIEQPGTFEVKGVDQAQVMLFDLA
ncbi:MAG: pirin family protein [Phycisphaeraceae bacterium]|nr:pirin family protein [Phycisphaeraceae bacterium]